jgi:hypothetical protein
MDTSPVLIAVTCSRASLLQRTVLQHHRLEFLNKIEAEEFNPVFHSSLMMNPTLFPHKMAEEAASHWAACISTSSLALMEEPVTLIPDFDYFYIQTALIQGHVGSTPEHLAQSYINNKDSAYKKLNLVRIARADLQPLQIHNKFKQTTAPF